MSRVFVYLLIFFLGVNIKWRCFGRVCMLFYCLDLFVGGCLRVAEVFRSKTGGHPYAKRNLSSNQSNMNC